MQSFVRYYLSQCENNVRSLIASIHVYEFLLKQANLAYSKSFQKLCGANYFLAPDIDYLFLKIFVAAENQYVQYIDIVYIIELALHRINRMSKLGFPENPRRL